MPILFEELRELLMEKLLILGNGKKYGQAVILAGGAGSGKGWVIKNLIGGDWKVYDPDEIKGVAIKVAKAIEHLKTTPIAATPQDMMFIHSETFKRIRTYSDLLSKLDLKDPANVSRLHSMVKSELNLDDKQMFISLVANKDSPTKPNVIMDTTLKSDRAAIAAANIMLQHGYKPEDIHIVWVLTDYKVALAQNYKRERRVYNSLLFTTHQGARKTMTELVLKDYGRLGINGDLCVVLGGRGEMFRPPEAGPGAGAVLRMKSEFQNEQLYIRVKKAGQNNLDPKAIEKIEELVKNLAPRKEGDLDPKLDKMYPQTAAPKDMKFT